MAKKQEDIEKLQAKQETDVAWQRFMNVLEQEPQNEYWEQMDLQGGVPGAPKEEVEAHLRQESFNKAQSANLNGIDSLSVAIVKEKEVAAAQPAVVKPRVRKSRRARKWAGLAVACAVVATVVITPTGNQALASILGNFRMEQVTEVNEQDMEQLFSSVFRSGISEQEINRFGTFSVETGKDYGELTVNEAAAAAGVPALPESLTGKQEHMYVSPGSKLSLKMNVSEINKVMKQLGASKLFPESVDGKTITLEASPVVYYNIPMNSDDSASGNLSQTRVPSVSIDDMTDMQEALDAVIQFPILPQNLKDSLQQSQILTTGEMPLPVFTGNGVKSEQITVGQTKVLLNTHNYQDAKQLEATWVKDGVLYNYNVYSEGQSSLEEQFRTKLQELVEA